MKIELLPAMVAKAAEDLTIQDDYVKSLGSKFQNGEMTIQVFSDNVWTTVLLKDFWEIQHNKYLAMATYAGELNGLLTNMQTLLDSTLATIVKPEDYDKSVAAAAAKVL